MCVTHKYRYLESTANRGNTTRCVCRLIGIISHNETLLSRSCETYREIAMTNHIKQMAGKLFLALDINGIRREFSV